MVKLEITEEEFEKLLDTLNSVDDEGPDGEGWKSMELEALIKKLETNK